MKGGIVYMKNDRLMIAFCLVLMAANGYSVPLIGKAVGGAVERAVAHEVAEAAAKQSLKTGVERACLVGVCQAVSRLLAGAAGRLAAGMGAGALTSQIDGLVPGPADLVALGICAVSAAVTAWEVRKAAKVIPAKLAQVMNETVNTQCAEVQRRALDEGEKLCLSYVRKVAFGSTETIPPCPQWVAQQRREPN